MKLRGVLRLEQGARGRGRGHTHRDQQYINRRANKHGTRVVKRIANNNNNNNNLQFMAMTNKITINNTHKEQKQTAVTHSFITVSVLMITTTTTPKRHAIKTHRFPGTIRT
jgi:hypothetical protein